MKAAHKKEIGFLNEEKDNLCISMEKSTKKRRKACLSSSDESVLEETTTSLKVSQNYILYF